MAKTFRERFIPKDQKQTINALEIKLLEESSLRKLTGLAAAPLGSLSQRERVKAAKLRERFPSETKTASKQSSMLLFVAFNPVLQYRGQRVLYQYTDMPNVRPHMPQAEIQRSFTSLLLQVQKGMGLNYKYRNVFTKEGIKVNNLYDLASGECTFIVTPVGQFPGVANVYIKDTNAKDRFIKQIAQLEYPLISACALEGQNGVTDYETREEEIDRKFSQTKADILSFTYMDKNALDSQSLKRLLYKPCKSLARHVPKTQPSFKMMQDAARSVISGSNANRVLEGMMKEEHYTFFRKDILGVQPPSEFELQQKFHQGQEESAPLEPAPEPKKKPAAARTAEEETELLERVRRMYVESTEPLVKPVKYRKLGLIEEYYELETKRGAPFNDEESLKQSIRAQLAHTARLPMTNSLKEQKKVFNHQVHSELRKILKKNRYNTAEVKVDQRLAHVPEEEPEEHDQHYGLNEIEQSKAGREDSVEHTRQISASDRFNISDRISPDDTHDKIHLKFQRMDGHDAGQDSMERSKMTAGTTSQAAESEVAIDLDFKQILGVKKKDYIESNRIAVMDTKSVIRLIKDTNKPLVSQNIPLLSAQTGFSREELHTLYTLYKALCHITSQRYGVMQYDVADGMDEASFRKGVYQVFIQSDSIAQKIFETIDYNMSHFMNWAEFLSGMQMIRAKTMSDKISLFIKLADNDGNGHLGQDEVSEFCRACLARFIKPEEGSEGFLTTLTDYFTKFIFDTLKYPLDKEIPLSKMKNYILEGKEGSHLLAMFCGADF